MPIQINIITIEEYLNWISSLGLLSNFTLKKINVNNLINKNSLVSVKFFHNSGIIYSDNANSNILNYLINSGNERLSNLEMIKYENKVEGSDIKEIYGSTSSYGEGFPWLIDEDGKVIDFNKSISLFNGVKLISRYLETRHGINKENLSDVKFTELLEPFKNNANVTVLDLLNHKSEIYDKNKNSLVKDLISGSDKTSVGDVSSGNAGVENLTGLKPFGAFGEITLNEIGEKMLKLRWDYIYNTTQITVNALPVAMNFISFNLILRSYMKYVHNRPYPNHMSSFEKEMERKIRDKKLYTFLVLGAPLFFIGLRCSGPLFKDMITISWTPGNTDNNMNTINNNNIFFLLLSKIYNYLPFWFKYISKIILVLIVVLKILGYNLIDIFIDYYLLKNILYVYSSLMISYYLLNLYLLHVFYTRKVKIPEVLPNFIINWLKDFEIMAGRKLAFDWFTKGFYIQIVIYIVAIIILLLLR